jgi:aminoglycoside phosphotransferase
LRRNCLLKHVTDGKIEERIEVKGRQGRRRRKVLGDLKERRSYWKLKEEALGVLHGDVALYEATVQL